KGPARLRSVGMTTRFSCLAAKMPDLAEEPVPAGQLASSPAHGYFLRVHVQGSASGPAKGVDARCNAGAYGLRAMSARFNSGYAVGPSKGTGDPLCSRITMAHAFRTTILTARRPPIYSSGFSAACVTIMLSRLE